MSLRTKVLLPLGLFSALLIAYLFVYWMPLSRIQMETEYRESLERHLASVAEGVIPLLLGHQLDSVYEYFDALKRSNTNWQDIELIDTDGRNIYPLHPPPAAPKDGPSGQVHSVQQRIRFRDMDLGTIVLRVDFAPRLSEMGKRHRYLVTVLLMVLSAFMLTAALVLEWVVRRPVIRLADASRKLADGVFDVPLVRTGSDEVGVLVDSFAAMRDAIRVYHAELHQRSQVLRQSEQKLAEAQRIAHLGSWELDLISNKLTWSDEIYRIFGVKPQAFGATYEAFLEAVHPEDLGAVNEAYTVSVRDGSPYDIVHRVRKPDGEIRYVHEKCEHIKDSSGAIILSRGTVQDITAARQTEEALRQSERKLWFHLQQTLLGVIEWDPEFRVREWNPAAESIFGYRREEALGRRAAELILSGQAVQDVAEVWQRLVQQKGGGYNLNENITRDNRTITCEWFNTPLNDDKGTLIGVMSLVRDISELKRKEGEIRKLNEELEERVARRTADLSDKQRELQDSQLALMHIVEDLNENTAQLEEANLKLKDLDRLKSVFIASMSHELRTPLNSIIGFSSILLNEWLGPVNAEQKKNLETILRSGRHLLALINDVIDVSKVEAGKFESIPEDFDLQLLLNEALALIGPEAAAKGLTAEAGPAHLTLHTDRRRLFQCVVNLLGNAVKFTPSGRIEVRTEVIRAAPEASSGDIVEITVTDTGIGIHEEDLGRLFQPFVRIPSALSWSVKGSGLGLYLVRKIATEILHGQVTAASRPGGGSSFCLRIPVKL